MKAQHPASITNAYAALFRLIFLLALSLALTACKQDDQKIPVSVVGYNHTDTYIDYFSVNGAGGSNLFPHGGGGAFSCCVVVPQHWQPGMKATIAWSYGERDKQHNLIMQQTVVEVPYYPPTNIGDFHVHFLRNGAIKVFVVNASLGFPDYPLKGEEAKL